MPKFKEKWGEMNEAVMERSRGSSEARTWAKRNGSGKNKPLFSLIQDYVLHCIAMACATPGKNFERNLWRLSGVIEPPPV